MNRNLKTLAATVLLLGLTSPTFAATATYKLPGNNVNGQPVFQIDPGTGLAVDYTPPGPLAGQAKIAVSGTSLAIGSGALANGIVIKAKCTNTSTVWVGASNVNSTDDGTGTGYPLVPCEAISFSVADLTNVYIVGTTVGDMIYYAGN